MATTMRTNLTIFAVAVLGAMWGLSTAANARDAVPARDEKNRKAEGKYRTRVRWVIPAGNPVPDLSKPFS